MKQTTRIAGLALAIVAAAALPLDSAMADKGGRHHKGDRHSYSYKPHYRDDYRHKDRGRHSHHHHYSPPVVVVAPPRYRHPHHHHDHYWRGSNLGFVYDSWTDSWRIGGNYYID